MKLKSIKLLVFITTLLLVLCMTCSNAYALITPNQVTPTDPSSSDIQNLGGRILGIITTVGIVLSVIILAILGIKYMVGSAEEKAEYKKTFIPYIVGAVCIFLAPTIANMIYSLLQ